MTKSKGIFISCEEAKHICDKSQYNEATFWERVKLTIRLLHCNVCRKYTKNNRKLTNLMKESQVETLKIAEKEKLQNAFNKELLNKQ